MIYAAVVEEVAGREVRDAPVRVEGVVQRRLATTRVEAVEVSSTATERSLDDANRDAR
jgi:hypothetical protein